jgi:hypothetical protein
LVKIVFVGPTARLGEVLATSKVVSCRRGVLKVWAEWLVENNPWWKDMKVDQEALTTYNVRDSPPQAFLDSALTEEDQDRCEAMMGTMESIVGGMTRDAPEPAASTSTGDAGTECQVEIDFRMVTNASDRRTDASLCVEQVRKLLEQQQLRAEQAGAADGADGGDNAVAVPRGNQAVNEYFNPNYWYKSPACSPSAVEPPKSTRTTVRPP